MLARPLPGLLALLLALAAQPLVRTLNRLVLAASGDWALWAFVLLGLAGILLVAVCLESAELPATLAGFTGGMLAWHGLAEGALRVFAQQFAVPATRYGGFPLDGRYALLMSTATILLGIFSVYGLLNRETRCNFMRWILRRLHWSPGAPTPGYRRSFARITAMETMFVQWLVFLLFLYLGSSFGSWFYLAMLLWASYLLWRLAKIPRHGLALRYAIPIAVILFSLVEVGAFFRYFPAYWQSLSDYPLANLLTLLVFGAASWRLLRERLV